MAIENIKHYKHIIWDWNGTLLDDVNIAISAMNCLLKRRNLPLLDTDRYRDVFTFPVKNYYARLGFDFDKEPFEELAFEFISEFSIEKHGFKLHNEAKAVLDNVRRLGIGQSILSASQESELKDFINKLGIPEYFINIAGLNDHYAISKAARGKELLASLNLRPEQVVLIGDTLHDYDVSKELGCDCLLVSNGHQNYKRISSCNANIVKTLSEVIDYLRVKAIAL